MVDRICDNCMSRVPADSDKCPRCGIRFENTNPGGALPNGWVLGGRYTVGRYIEIDGEGVTYSAIDGNTLQRVTIKEYMPVTLCATRDETGSIVAKPGNEVLFKTTRMDFRELYDTLLRMGLTEGLVQVLDVLEENNTAYAVLEKIEGPTLTEYLTKSSAPIDASRAMAILRPVLMGVEAMHAANLVHRGISPDNIILESGGTAKLCGYAILALRQQGSELKPKLYPGYSAPEQYAANEFEGRYTDIYALGAVLYRMVTGEVPAPADERKMQDDLRPARTLNKEVPTFLSTGIGRAMRLVPAERIQNISDLRLALTGEGGRDAKGPLGLTKQQMIVAAGALGVIVVLLVVVILVSVLGGKDKDKSSTSGSSSALTSSAVASGVENPVPDFTNQTKPYVENRYTEYSFRWEEAYSASVPEGYIISQDPAKDTEYTGQTITLVVSLGEDPALTQVNVPDVTTAKTSLEDALRKLDEAGVNESNIIITDKDNDGNYEEGQIMQQDPAPGTVIDIKTGKVTLYVASEKPVKMPDLYGMTWDAATAELEKLGLEWNEANWVANEGGQHVPFNVVGTNIAANTNIYPSQVGRITIDVAKNAAMPDVIGRTEEVARNMINALATSQAKVQITITVETHESSQPAGIVYDTSIKAGSEVTSGSTVILYVSAGSGGGEGSGE